MHKGKNGDAGRFGGGGEINDVIPGTAVRRLCLSSRACFAYPPPFSRYMQIAHYGKTEQARLAIDHSNSHTGSRMSQHGCFPSLGGNFGMKIELSFPVEAKPSPLGSRVPFLTCI